MTVLKEITRDIAQRSHNSFKLDRQPQIVAARKAVEERFGGFGRVPSQVELGEVHEKFVHCLVTDNWSSLTRQNWKRVAFVFFWDAEKPLISQEVFNEKYEEWLKEQSGASAWKRLLYAYMLNFDKRNKYTDVFQGWASYIRQTLNAENAARTLGQWQERDKAFDVFNLQGDVQKVAQAYLYAPHWESFSEATGLKGELEKRGYIFSVAQSLIKILQTGDKGQSIKIRNFFDLSDGIRTPEFRATIIDAFLAPWNNRTPESDYKKELQAWLIDKFGDPRLIQKRQSGWSGVSPSSIDIFKRWMVEETLDQFFGIISEIADKSHWKYRKKFWKAYFDEGFIRDAWVVLGIDAQNYARRAFGNSVGAGRLNGGESNHSVLIIQIEDYIFSEWSHNGKCRAWRKGESGCPDLHRLSYDAGDFKTRSLKIVDRYQEDGITHAASERYSWQRNLADFIKRKTGAKIEQRKYTLSAYD